MSEQRTEAQVVTGLSDNAQQLLRRVLIIERSKLHLERDTGTTDLILAAVKEIIP